MKGEILPNYIESIATTAFVAGQHYFELPYTIKNPIQKVEVFNEKKNTWEKVDFRLVLRMHKRKLKTDKTIKIYYDANRT